MTRPHCTGLHQGRGAVADAAVTCMAMLMVATSYFQFGVFLSLINHSRPDGGGVVFNILSEPSKVLVLQPRVWVTSPSPSFIAPTLRNRSPAGKAPSPSPPRPAARVAPVASGGEAGMLGEGKAALLISRGTRSLFALANSNCLSAHAAARGYLAKFQMTLQEE